MSLKRRVIYTVYYSDTLLSHVKLSWEPPEPSTQTVPELQELRNKIADIRQDHIKRGLIRVDGRTM